MSHLFRLVSRCALIAIAVAWSADAAASAPAWTPAWEDDFQTLDQSKWEVSTSFSPTNNSRHAYLPSQVSVDGGDLVLTSENVPAGNLPYRSGLVTSRSEQKYGRWEVRAKLPTSTGMWPAIWLLPDTSRHAWPSGGEIDIMENRGTQPHLTSSAFHYGTNPPYSHSFVYGEQATARLDGSLADYHDEYHTYAVDWTPHYLRFYVDGVNHYTVHNEDVGGFLSGRAKPMQLVLNTAIGGHFLDDPDASTVWPQEFRIDSVRVFELSDETAELSLSNGGFEQDGGGLSGWSVFGNDLHNNPNVRVADEAVRTGAASLKVYGNFQSGVNYSGVTQGITVESGDEVSASLHALVRSADRLAAGNRVEMKIEFYDRFGGKFGSAQMVDQVVAEIADAATPTDAWAPHALTATAPLGAVEARLAIVFEQPGVAGGAVHVDDVAFAALPETLSGDHNGDGVVDAADFTAWRDETPAGQDPAGYVAWRTNYAAVAAATAEAVPEPAAAALAAAASLLAGSMAVSRATRR